VESWQGVSMEVNRGIARVRVVARTVIRMVALHTESWHANRFIALR